MSLRVAVVGGGPGGLFLAALLRTADPTCTVTVYERNQADDTFGFGVVFSDRTLAGIHAADPVLREGLEAHGRHWEDIEVRLKGEVLRCGGNGMTAIVRRRLLQLLQARARAAGADLRFGVEVQPADLVGADVVVAADGGASTVRRWLGDDVFGSTVETATAKFIWFGAEHLFDGLTFVHEKGPHGVFAVHGYPISDRVSTFIVETDESSWRAAGLDAFDVSAPPGPSDLASQAYLEELFADQIAGARLLGNNSRWGSFRTRRSTRWTVAESACGPVALLGDAAHTAHFSVGSGTKMAMEDAVALSAALVAHAPDVPAALAAYEAAARPSVEAVQASARPSLSWWERFGQYHDAFEPWQFAYHFLSRSITDARLGRRAPDFVAASHDAWHRRYGTAPLRTPLEGPVPLPGRTAAVDAGHLHTPDGALPLDTSGGPGLWGAWATAPDDEAGLPAATEAVRQAAAAGAALAVVVGGTPLTRSLLSEQVRFTCGVPSVLLEPSWDRDAAVTTVLSGRADVVAADPETVHSWREP